MQANKMGELTKWDEAMKDLREIEDLATNQFISSGVTAVVNKYSEAVETGALSTDFDMQFFVKVMKEVFQNKGSLLGILNGQEAIEEKENTATKENIKANFHTYINELMDSLKRMAACIRNSVIDPKFQIAPKADEQNGSVLSEYLEGMTASMVIAMDQLADGINREMPIMQRGANSMLAAAIVRPLDAKPILQKKETRQNIDLARTIQKKIAKCKSDMIDRKDALLTLRTQTGPLVAAGNRLLAATEYGITTLSNIIDMAKQAESKLQEILRAL